MTPPFHRKQEKETEEKKRNIISFFIFLALYSLAKLANDSD